MAKFQWKALPRGKYVVRCKEESLIAAASNGHSSVWPTCEAISDGTWVMFLRAGKEVYGCNAVYAAAHFDAQQVAE